MTDIVTDSPTNNFCVLNYNGGSGTKPVDGGLSGSAAGTSGWRHSYGTFPLTRGKWYWEYRFSGSVDGSNGIFMGLAHPDLTYERDINSISADMYGRQNQDRYANGTNTGSIFANVSSGDTVQFAFDADTGVMWSGLNNTWTGADPSTGNSPSFTGIDASKGYVPMTGSYGSNNYNKVNFGQQGFKYTPPSGYKAICSEFMEMPEAKILNPKKHFDVVTWSGNSSTSNRKISGLEFQPDLVWTKTRNHTYHHVWFDSNRGPSFRINADRSEAENTTNGGYLASFDHDGFTWQYGGGSSNEWWNESGKNYVAWCWKAGGTAVANSDGDVTSQVSVNDEAGFSIVKFTFPASGDAFSVGHGLGKIPELIIMKNRSHNNNWDVYHHGNGNSPEHHRLRLNTNDSRQDATAWNDFVPTSTIFKSRTSGNWYNANSNAIAYCWYSIPGYSAFGCYEGNGQSDGPFIYTGFRPAMIITKSYSNGGGSYNWFMCDSTRGPRNNIYQRFQPNDTSSEVTDSSNAATVDFYSDGFKLRGTGSMLNGNTVEYVYMAWAEQSTNTPYASEPNAR